MIDKLVHRHRSLFSLVIFLSFFPTPGLSANSTSPPKVVNIGALFTFNSTIGRVAKVAISGAVNDVNNDSTVLNGTKLVVEMQDTKCNGFDGIIQALQFMEKDVVAILGPQSSVIAHVIAHLANELKVPLLSFSATDPTLTSLEYPFVIQTTRSDLFQMAAIADLIDYYQWKQVVAIYLDDDFGRNGIAALGDKLADRRLKISNRAGIRPGSDRSDITDLLVKLALVESRVIVLHADLGSGLLVFSVANYLGMMSEGYVWIVTDWLSAYLDSILHADEGLMDMIQGIITLRQHTPNSQKKRALVSNWAKLVERENATENIRLNTYGLYAYDTVWLIARALDAYFTNDGNISFSADPKLQKPKNDNGSLHLEAMSLFDGGKMLLDNIQNVSFTGVTGLVQYNDERHLIKPAYDIINIIGTGFRVIGFWSNYSGLSVVSPETLYTRPPNKTWSNQQLHPVIWPGGDTKVPRGWTFAYNGRELRIGVPNRVSYREFVTESRTTGIVSGFCIDVFVAAVNLLPYPVSYSFVPFGNGKENPSYSGLVQKVVSNEIDGAVGDISIVTNRTKVVDFTQPFVGSGLVVLVPMKRQKSDSWAFLQPFTLSMWGITGVFFLLVGVVVWILEHRINEDFRGPPKRQLITVLWFSFSTLFFSHKENTISILGRAVLIIWLFVVLIIQSSYTASLTSILTVQQISTTIHGIEDLQRTDDPIGFQVGSFTENYLVEELGISRSRLKALGTVEAYAEALELGPHHGGVAAIVDERPYVDLFVSTQCNFTIVGSEFTKSGWGFAFPRDSELAVDLSTAILKLSENGDLQRIHNKWFTRSTCSTQTDLLEANQLEFSSFSGLFLICGLACLLALVVYFVILLIQFYKQAHEDETDASSSGSSRLRTPRRSIRGFLSFVDNKDESVNGTPRKSQTGNLSTNGLGIEN
ncbi:Glutamate receptor [Rhynchospora pubera]|uniref:Glutamate receptor n=1 Tax=Rhynchospora pubera TaxID=906938 RepID=A0AAV8GAX9_9POAL|nr:Glutamate receptor [Rhynchospora pubera]